MKFEEYLIESSRTLADTFFLEDNGRDYRVLHAAIGICTEVGEIFEAFRLGKENGGVDVINLSEELADVMWYVAIVYREYDLTFYDEHVVASSPNFLEIVELSAEFLDILKKKTFYGKDIDQAKMEASVREIVRKVYTLAWLYDIEMENALKNNIDKLRKRFPDKFSTDDAINRDTDIERTELEKGM